MVELGKAGRNVRELAKEFGYHQTSISAWVRRAKAYEVCGFWPDAPLTTAEPPRVSPFAPPVAPSHTGPRHIGKGYGQVCQQAQRHRQDIYALI